MPIGFWAISRQEVIDMLNTESFSGFGLSTQEINEIADSIIRRLPDRLERTLHTVINEEKRQRFES